MPFPTIKFAVTPHPDRRICKIRVYISATCIGPLGMESGMIEDNQIKASSSFEHASVGPHNARFDLNYEKYFHKIFKKSNISCLITLIEFGHWGLERNHVFSYVYQTNFGEKKKQV